MPSTLLERPTFEPGAHSAPREAFRFRTPVQLEFAEVEDGAKVVPVTILARTPDVVDHWYFGPCIHDMTGVRFKDKIPLDWNHWHEMNLGFADQIAADEKTGLSMNGKLISVRDDDMAAEIIKRGKHGVPYEFSIEAWVPWRLEYLAEGMTAECNGRTIDGPCLIFREWTLKAGAFCMFGVDAGTRTNFSQLPDDRNREPLGDVEFILFSEPHAMAKANDSKNTKTTDAPAEGTELSSEHQDPPAATTEEVQAAFAAKLAKFTAEFGEVNGAKWAAAGKTYEEALKLHADDLAAKLAATGEASKKEIDDLKAKLAAVDTGEADPVSFSDAGGKGGDAKGSPLAQKLGNNLAAFASSIKIPAAAK